MGLAYSKANLFHDLMVSKKRQFWYFWRKAWRKDKGKLYISLLDRYIFAELMPPFLFSVGLFSILGVAIGYLSELANKVTESNLPLTLAVQVLLLKVPEYAAYALPVAILLGTLMTYGRLSNDGEIVAFGSCGVSLRRLILPAIFLSCIVTGLTFWVNEQIVPAANYRASSILVKSIGEERNFWQTKDIIYPQYEQQTLSNGLTKRHLKSLFYAEKFDGQDMKTLIILRWLGDNLGEIILAERASWNFQAHLWDFYQGTVYFIAADASYHKSMGFEHQQFSLPKVPLDLALQSRDPYEMNIDQALEYIKLLRLTGEEKKLRMFQVRTQQKIAFPFVCLVFALVGSALGSQPQQMSRATSFGLGVGIIFSYYLLGFLIGSLGLIGVLSPMMAAWLPNILALVAGAWLLYNFSES